MKQGSTLVIELCDDGSIKLNGTGLIGTEQELLKDLQGLAKEVGGKLTVEKHIHKHDHSHSHDEHDHHKH